MRVLIVGCGYVGLPLGVELVRRGHEVFGLRRTADDDDALLQTGLTPLVGDVSRLADLQKLPGPYDWVVNTVSSSKGGASTYQEVYVHGTRNLLQWLSSSSSLKKYVYTSSTSVYGQTDGSCVDETSLTQPLSPTSQLLAQTERMLLQAAQTRGFPCVILRVAGIYGPERGYLFLKYLSGEARLHGQGHRLINMIHRDDLVGCIQAALERGQPGHIYNAGDDEPVAQRQFFHWLSQQLGRPMPPQASAAEDIRRKRGLTNKRVSNQKLKTDLGYQFKYPTFREGYAAEIRRLGLAGCPFL